MDSFMDKLAQKFNAQEMINANIVAEEKELEKRRAEAEEYKEYLRQMKALNQENAELSEKMEKWMKQMKQLTDDSVEKMNRMSEESFAKVNKLADEGVKTVAELATINEEKLSQLQVTSDSTVKAEVDLSTVEENMTMLTQSLEAEKKRLAELFEQTNEYVHRENVKVYRNVQAVVVEEVKNRSEEITRQLNAQNEEVFERLAQLEKSTSSVKPAVKVTMAFAIVAAIASIGGIAFYVLTMLGII